MEDTLKLDPRQAVRIRYFAEAYEMLMHMERSGSTSHMGTHSPRNVLNTYLRFSEELGVRLMNDHCLERMEEIITAKEIKLRDVVIRVFGSQNEGKYVQ